MTINMYRVSKCGEKPAILLRRDEALESTDLGTLLSPESFQPGLPSGWVGAVSFSGRTLYGLYYMAVN